MDRQMLDVLRKVRQDYLEVVRTYNAIIDEQTREPKQRSAPPETKIGGCLFWGLAIFLFIVGAICVFANISQTAGNIFALLSLLVLVVWIISLITWPIRKMWNDQAHDRYLIRGFAEEVQKWQERVNERQEAFQYSIRQYFDDADTCAGILPETYLNPDYKYRGTHPVVAITEYMENRRVRTIEEAIALYEGKERETVIRQTEEVEAVQRAIAREAAWEAGRARRNAEDLIRLQKEANQINKRRASAAEDMAASAKKSAEEAETIRRIHTGERGVR